MTRSRLFYGASISLAILVFISGISRANESGPVSINEVLQEVYRSNPTLMVAREELEETRELYPQAKAGWLPTLSAEASIYSTDIDSSPVGSSDGDITKDMSLNVNQPIWRGGRTFAETSRARDLIAVGEARLDQKEQDIFLSAITVYLDIIRDRELFHLRERNEKLLVQELKSAWERLDIGDITDTDVQQAKTRLSRAKSAKTQAQNNYELSRAAFSAIVGLDTPEELLIPYPEFPFPETIEEMIAYAEEKNPEIVMADFQSQAANHNSDATSRELLPQVSAFASLNKQYNPQASSFDESRATTVGVRATLALFQGGATRSRVRAAQTVEKRREHEISEVKRRIKQQIISNWRSYLSAKLQTENRKAEIESAQAALDGVRVEMAEGQRTVLDILDADQELINAQAGLLNALRNEKLSQYALANNLGMLTAEETLGASN